MKQHYKVWVYDNCGVATVESKDYSIAVSEKENVIVLTIEELKEVFQAGMDKIVDERSQGGQVTTFDQYLQSKGIKLTDNG